MNRLEAFAPLAVKDGHVNSWQREHPVKDNPPDSLKR